MSITIPKNQGLANTVISLQSGVLSSAEPFPAAFPEDSCSEYNDGAILKIDRGIQWGGEATAYGAGQITSGSRTIYGIEERFLGLSQSGFSRPFSFVQGWKALRVGVLLAVDDSGGNLTSPDLSIGLCAGHSSRWPGGDRQHWVGVQTETQGGDWTRSTGNGGYYSGGQDLRTTYAEANGTPSDTGFSDAEIPYNPAESGFSNRRTLFLVDMQKAGSDLEIQTINITTPGSFESDMNWDQALECIGHSASATVLTHWGRQSFNMVGANTLTGFDEGTNGVLDRLDIYWSETTVLEIYGYTVQLLA